LGWVDEAFGVLEIVRHHEITQARGMVQEFPHGDLLRHGLVGIFRHPFRQRVVPRQLAGLDQLRDGDRGEHLADRGDMELRLVIDRQVEAAFGQATAFVEHGLAPIENAHAAGEVGYAHQPVQYGVYLFCQLRMRHRPLGPADKKRIIHRHQHRLRQPVRMCWIGGQPEQGGLRVATCLDGHFQQARLVRIGAYIEHIQPPAVACRRNQVRNKRRLVVGGHGWRQDTRRPLAYP
jgi:hypothetical protein